MTGFEQGSRRQKERHRHIVTGCRLLNKQQGFQAWLSPRQLMS